MFARRRLTGAAIALRQASVAIACALALLGAPALGAVSDSCPPDCPMHGHATGGATRHLGCHCHASVPVRAHPSGSPTQGPSLACGAFCSHNFSIGIPLRPALARAAQIFTPLTATAPAHPADPMPIGRAPDPPDTPPPIFAV